MEITLKNFPARENPFALQDRVKSENRETLQKVSRILTLICRRPVVADLWINGLIHLPWHAPTEVYHQLRLEIRAV